MKVVVDRVVFYFILVIRTSATFCMQDLQLGGVLAVHQSLGGLLA